MPLEYLLPVTLITLLITKVKLNPTTFSHTHRFRHSYSYTSTSDEKVAAQAIASIAGCVKSAYYKDLLECVRNTRLIQLQ